MKTRCNDWSKYLLKRVLSTIFVVLAVSLNSAEGQLSVNASVTAANAVQNVLLGEGVTASNITFSGNQSTQIGSFNCNNCGINLSSGVIMGSGHVNGAVGPNNSGSFSLGPPSGIDYAGDPDLQVLSGNASLHNAAILRFNFVPNGDSLAFRFVFGSEEYPEYVNSINDVFGFFISGPGISGPYQNNAKNIALIPNTATPISINTVNQYSNTAWYTSNNGQYNVQPDGFTKVLTARTNVICGATYQIKIAIADASDGSWDSWVFLEAGSFESNNVELSYTPPVISPSGVGIYEGCDVAYINFTRPQAQSAEEMLYNLSFSGTAINGIDIEEIPNSLVFPAGQSVVSIPIVALVDNIPEGNENFIITVLELGCNLGDPVSFEFIISDPPELIVDIPDVVINCGEEAFIEPQISGGLGNYMVTWENGLVQPSFSTFPTSPVSYPFTVSDTCSVNPVSGTANVLFVQNPPLVVDIGADITAQCLDEININSAVSGGFGEYSYQWTSNGAQVSTAENLTFFQSTNQVVVLTVTDICGVNASDQLNLIYPATPMTADIGPDLVATCIDNNTVGSIVTGGVGNYSYTWKLNGNPIGNAASTNVQTGVTSTLTFNVADQCGNSAADALTVTIPPVNIVLDIGPDLVATCLDNTVNSAIQLENGIGNYSYVWTNNGQPTSSAAQYTVQTGETKTIGLTVTDQCGNTAFDQHQIIIPAAPIALTVFPSPDTMICLGTWGRLGALASGGVGNLTYTWSGITSVPTSSQNYSIVRESPPANMSYSVKVSDQCGNSNSGQMRISVRELFPEFDSEYLNDVEVKVKNTTVGNDPFKWTFGNGRGGSDSTEVVNFTGAPAWTVTLTVFSPEGCAKSKTQEYTAIGELFIPNAFTPDNDGVNDFFFVKGHDLRYFEFTIFNRYGDVVFKSYDMTEPWDGSHQRGGHYVPAGIYPYQIVAIGNRENMIEYKGAITVVR